MKKIFYKGIPYESLIVDMEGKKKYALYKNHQFTHFIDEDDLDKNSRVSMVLDAYYESLRLSDRSAILQEHAL